MEPSTTTQNNANNSQMEYVFGRVVPTLVMIESPQDNIDFEPIPTTDSDDAMAKDPEHITRPTTQYISSSFRRSFHMLRAEGGRFRGFAIFVAHRAAVAFVAKLLSNTLGFLPIFVWAVGASVLCAQLSLGWTLIVISKPSPKFWFRRIPSMKMMKKIAIPTAVHALATQAALAAPVYLFIALGLSPDLNQVVNMPDHERNANVGKSFGVMVFGLILSLVLTVPATVMLTRVQASLLSDDEETIVPFDRTFGGKVIPEIVGGSGTIGMLEAWTSFDWSARVRLVKAYVKTFAIVFAMCTFFTILLIAETAFVMSQHEVLIPDDGNN